MLRILYLCHLSQTPLHIRVSYLADIHHKILSSYFPHIFYSVCFSLSCLAQTEIFLESWLRGEQVVPGSRWRENARELQVMEDGGWKVRNRFAT